MNRDSMLRYIVAIHFICTSMVNMAEWLPFGYTLNQIALIALGIWAIIHADSVIHIEMLLLLKCITIILDCIAIGMYFQIGKRNYQLLDHSSYFTLSAFFAFLLLVLKLVMLLLLNKIRSYRLGDQSPPIATPWGEPDPTKSVPGYVPVSGQNF